MSLEDMRINKHVRVALVKNYYQTELLQFTSKGRVVTIRGTLRKTISTKNVSSSDLETLEQAISSIPQVRGVLFDLDNWHKDNTHGWRREEKNDDKKKKDSNYLIIE
ncbi:MAG: hypothetical protein V1872_13860 [bacterium]